jgi:hypothetical protein
MRVEHDPSPPAALDVHHDDRDGGLAEHVQGHAHILPADVIGAVAIGIQHAGAADDFGQQPLVLGPRLQHRGDELRHRDVTEPQRRVRLRCSREQVMVKSPGLAGSDARTLQLR